MPRRSGFIASILWKRGRSTSCLTAKLFEHFDKYHDLAGYFAMDGQIVDATVVAALRQGNTDEETKNIKAGRIPQDWREKPAMQRQKDRDARWTVKFSKAKVDENGQTHKRDIVLPAFWLYPLLYHDTGKQLCAFDGAQLRTVLSKDNTASMVWADTAYRSKGNETWLKENGFFSDSHCKKSKGRAMDKATSRANHRRSKVRSKVEHVFARIKAGSRTTHPNDWHKPRPPQDQHGHPCL